jgi:hypothetical protein
LSVKKPMPNSLAPESTKRSEKARELLLKHATEEPLQEKTADAGASDGAVDEDDPVQMNSSQRHYQPHRARQMSSWLTNICHRVA